MAKLPAFLPIALLLLAGCSGSPDEEAFASTPTPTYTVTALSPQDEVLTTDTYHLLAKPDMTAQPPMADEPVRVPVASLFQETLKVTSGTAYRDTWNVTLPQDVRGFVGQASLVVEIKGGVAGNPFPTSNGCFWALTAVVDEGGPGNEFDLGCIPEGSSVPAGLYELAFPFAYPEATLSAGSVLHIEFHTNENIERPPGSSVDLLTASVPYDSTLQVYGLDLPLDGSLLLQATA